MHRVGQPARLPDESGAQSSLRRPRNLCKEQLPWLRPFRNVEEMRLVLLAWKDRCNRSWLSERHGHISREQRRQQSAEELRSAA